MSATQTSTGPAAIHPALKGLLLLFAGVGAGFLTCWYAEVKPARTDVDRLAALLGPGSDVSTVARLDSGIRALQGERDAEKDKVRKAAEENELLRARTAALTEERAAVLEQLETAQTDGLGLRTELSGSKEQVQAKEDALARARRALDEAEQRCTRTAAERDAFEQSMQALQKQVAEPAPIQLSPVEAGWKGSPSALAKRAQSDEVLRTLSPLLAEGHHQPFREPTSEPLPFSLRALERAGALDRANPESLYRLWILVAARENDRTDRWPTDWAPGESADWLERWFETRAADAIPALDRAQVLLIELGPTLVELRMLAP